MPEIRSLSPFPATRTFFSINLSTNICLLFKRHLRVYFDFPSKTQHPSPPLLPEIQRKKQPNPPLEDLFFARKSCRFYVPKMSLKNANGCSVCAWLLTSGGLRLTLRLTPQRHPRASRSGADQAHTLSRTNQRLNRSIPSRKRERAPPRRTTKSAAGSGAVPAEPLGIGCHFSPPLALSFYGLIVLQILSAIINSFLKLIQKFCRDFDICMRTPDCLICCFRLLIRCFYSII